MKYLKVKKVFLKLLNMFIANKNLTLISGQYFKIKNSANFPSWDPFMQPKKTL